MSTHELLAFGWAALALFVVLCAYRIGSGHWNPWLLAEGADRRASLSKFQLLVWTAAAIVAVIAVVAERNLRHVSGEIASLPDNLLLAMGFSVITATAAKGITISRVTSGQVQKPPPPTNQRNVFADLVNDDA